MKKNRVTQQSAILKHLQEKGSITSKEAFNLFGATRLSAQIFELRRKGYNIETITRYGKTRFIHLFII